MLQSEMRKPSFLLGDFINYTRVCTLGYKYRPYLPICSLCVALQQYSSLTPWVFIFCIRYTRTLHMYETHSADYSSIKPPVSTAAVQVSI